MLRIIESADFPMREDVDEDELDEMLAEMIETYSNSD